MKLVDPLPIILPTLKEKTLSEIRPELLSSTPVCPDVLSSDVTWESINVKRCEGETYFEPRCMVLEKMNTTPASVPEKASCHSKRPLVTKIPITFRAHTSLPLSDAVDLLLGIDHTGLMAWEGSRQLLRWLAWAFFKHIEKQMSSSSNIFFEHACSLDKKEGLPSVRGRTTTCTVVELGAGSGFLSVGLLALRDAAAAVNRSALSQSSLKHHEESQVSQYSDYASALLAPALFDTRESDSYFNITVTDGSDECVDLINSNIQLHHQLRPSTDYFHHIQSDNAQTKSGECGCSTACGKVFWWGNAETANQIVNRCASGVSDSTPNDPSKATNSSSVEEKCYEQRDSDNTLIIIAGDVVYGEEAVEPLSKAANDLAKAHQEKHVQRENDSTIAASPCLTASANNNNALWVLSWMPRCLTTQQNYKLFDKLLRTVTREPQIIDSTNGENSTPKRWVLKEIFLREADELVKPCDQAGSAVGNGAHGDMASPNHLVRVCPSDLFCQSAPLASDGELKDFVKFEEPTQTFKLCAMDGCILCLSWI